MKKILLGTSALIAAVALSTSAQAADGKTLPAGLSLSGGYSSYFGLANNSTAYNVYNNFDVKTSGSIKFSYANTLPSGLAVTISSVLDIGGDHGNPMDSNSATLGSATAGTFGAGQLSGLAPAINHNAGSVSSAQVGFNDPDMHKWIKDPNGVFGTDTVVTTYINDNRANEIGYQSPSFGGVSVFGTYIPDIDRGAGSGANGIFANNAHLSQYQIGAAFDKTMNGVTLGADAAYANTLKSASASTSIKALEQYQLGLSIGASGFTVAGGYNHSKWTNLATTAGTAKVYDLGAGYTAGPATVGLTWNHFEGSGASAAAVSYATGNTTSTAPKDDVIQLSGAYTVGTGVSLTGEIDYLQAKTGVSNGTAAAGTANNTGYVVATGFSLSF